MKLEKCEILMALSHLFDLISPRSQQRRERLHGEFAAGMLSSFTAEHNFHVFGSECTKPALGAGVDE